MEYLSLTDLHSESFEKSEYILENKTHSKVFSNTLFLSYRRKDQNYVLPIVRFLRSLGIDVYIDYLDKSLPDSPGNETAVILRERLSKSKKFLLLGTPGAKDSKWVPWELGLGDGFCKFHNVVILPLVENRYLWPEQEYFNIYAHMKKNIHGEWVVVYPSGTDITIEDWINKL